MQEIDTTNSCTASLRGLLSVGVITVLIGTVLGIASAGANVHRADLRLARWLQSWQGQVPDGLQRIGDMLGGTRGAIGLLAILLVIMASRRDWWAVLFVGLTAAMRLLALGLKGVFDSPRPSDDLVTLVRLYDSYGFPSGHTLSITMAATATAFIVWNITGSRQARGIVTVTAVGLMLLVGWSRVWSGAHWPSDVLGGWSFGVGFVCLAWAGSQALVCRASARAAHAAAATPQD